MGSGIFQSELVLSTLASHFTATNSLGDDMKLADNPAGALLLSLVAVSYFLHTLLHI
jgi:hypothetical protein